MPKNDPEPTRDQLQAEAEQHLLKAAELRRQLEERAAEEQRRRAQGERAWDEEFIAAHPRATLNAQVDQARERLDQALVDSPLVAAISDFATAEARRRTLSYELQSAQLRLDPRAADRGTAPLPDAYVLSPADRLAAAVDQAVADRLAADAAQREADRAAAGERAAGTS